jgi:hypothetical protein
MAMSIDCADEGCDGAAHRWRNGTGYRQPPLGTADDEISEG